MTRIIQSQMSAVWASNRNVPTDQVSFQDKSQTNEQINVCKSTNEKVLKK